MSKRTSAAAQDKSEIQDLFFDLPASQACYFFLALRSGWQSEERQLDNCTQRFAAHAGIGLSRV
jgi:hypothetical protein